ncbi:LamG-like jellyroll fold domain-containing protein [Actinoplanes sp. CA-030573]|uniref:LamG-like jellyroll fold domain-containing protein n=1 Tax=Actinoplanes sp. CA-030573 TaxID=3239898 RepID=UPI003D934DF7
MRKNRTLAAITSAVLIATFLDQTASPASAAPRTPVSLATGDLTPRADVSFDSDETDATTAGNTAGPALKLLNGAKVADIGYYPAVSYYTNSAVFDGVDDYGSAPLGLATSGSFSVSAWASATKVDRAQTILSQSGTAGAAFALKVDASGKWSFSMSRSDVASPAWDTVTGPAAKAGLPTQVGAVYDATAQEMRLYVNGVKAGTAKHTTTWAAAGEFEVGRGRAAGQPGEFLAGNVDAVHAYTGVVSDAAMAVLAVDSDTARADRCDIGHWLHAGGENVKATASAALAGTDYDRRVTYQVVGIGFHKLDEASIRDRDAYLAAFRALGPQHETWETVIDPYKYWGDDFINFWSAPEYGNDVIRFLMDRNDQTFHDYLNPPPPAKPAQAELDRALAVAADMRARNVLAPEDWQIKSWSGYRVSRFLRFGGYPTVTPVPGSAEFRLEVEAVKIGWSDCNPEDPDGTLDETTWWQRGPGPLAQVTAAATAEWNAELAAQAPQRNAIVAAEVQVMKDLRKASDAMVETQGQAWVVGQLLRWKKYWLSRPKTDTDYPTAAQFTKATSDMQAGINKINAQLTIAKAAATSAATQATNVTTAQSQAATIANTNQTPLYRGLAYAQQSAQVVKASSAATQSASKAIETTLNAAKATNADGKALEALASTQQAAQQAEFRRVAAQEAAAQAKAAADAADAQATQAAQMAARAKADRATAEKAEAAAKTAAEDAKAKRLVAEKERDNAAAARQKADAERAKARAAEERAQQQRTVAANARGSAVSSANTAAAKAADAEDRERRAGELRDAAVAAEKRRDSLNARANATEAAAQAAAGTADAGEARQAANEARAAADQATAAAGSARSAANEAGQAAQAARAAATEADGAATRSEAAADGAQADANTAHAQSMTAHAAAADAINAAQVAAQNVKNAEAEAKKALAASATAKAQAAEARNQATIAQEQSAIAAGHAYAAGQSAIAARDSSLESVKAALEAMSMGGPYKDSDASAGLAVLVGQNSKSLAEQQAAVAQAKADEAARAAAKAKDLAAQADANAKVAAQAAAAAAADAARALDAVKRARASAAAAATDAAAAQRAAANAAGYDAQAAQEAALATSAATQARGEADAALAAADDAERDAASARAAATAAENDASFARQAATEADQWATQAELSAANARALAADADAAAVRAEQADRAEDEAARQGALTNGDSPGGGGDELSSDDLAILLASCGQACVDEYKQALADAGKTVLQWIKDNGVEILLDVIGYTDLKNCFMTGDVEACLWTLVNVGSLVIAVGKLPAVTKAIVKVGSGITKFLEAAAAGRRTLERLKKVISYGKDAAKGWCSFSPDTQVLMADGSRKAIGRIGVGDRVLAGDPVSGTRSGEAVGEVWVHRDTMVVLDVAGAALTTTADHPFWDVTQARFVPAGELAAGDEVLTSDGRTARVGGLRWQTAHEGDAYNLTVGEVHTYYVFAGDTAVLVHNACRLSPLTAKDFGKKRVHIHASNGVEVALRPSGDGVVFRLIYSRDAAKFDVAAKEVEQALKSPTFRAKVLDQLRQALPGLASDPDKLVRNRSIEVHRLIKLLEKMG